MRIRFRWLTIAMIVVLVIINYIDRSAISYAVAPLSSQFGITTAEYGYISSAFSLGYLVFALVSGPLVDRYGPRRILLVGVIVWSLASAITPVSGGFIGLLLIRIVLGIGEAPGFPAATRITSRWLRQGERGFALALIGGVAVSGSLLIGGPIVTQLISATGWRGTFWILGAAGLVWAVAAVGLLHNTPADNPRVPAAERAHIAADQRTEEAEGAQSRVDWHSLLTNRNLWIVGAGYFAWGFMFWGFLYWLPSYLSKSFGLSLTAVGAFSVAPWAAGVGGAVIGGVLVDRLYKRSRHIRSRFAVIGVALLLSGASMIPVIIAPSLVTALTSISLGVGFGFITGGIWWVVSIDAEPSQPASAAGFADAAFALSGIVAPSVMGWIVSGTGTFTSGFVVMAVLAIVAAGLMLGCTRERRAPASVAEQAAPVVEGLG
ncbi:MAG TPA: MFS transporter [Trebonia sp.]|nr:MFS transporter [Trebonia sp.]